MVDFRIPEEGVGEERQEIPAPAKVAKQGGPKGAPGEPSPRPATATEPASGARRSFRKEAVQGFRPPTAPSAPMGDLGRTTPEEAEEEAEDSDSDAEITYYGMSSGSGSSADVCNAECPEPTSMMIIE